MSNSAKAEAVLALHRFGMGPRPGSIAAIESDPRGALIAELERSPSAAISASLLPSSAKAYRIVIDANAKRQAKAIVATKAEAAKRKEMAEAAPMVEGTTPGMSAAAEKMAAEAIPDPGRPIYLQEAKVRTEAALSAEIGFLERLVGSGPITSASRPTRSRACLAPTSVRPFARTCSASSSTCCWPPKAIRRC